MANDIPQMTPQTLKVLETLMAAPQSELSGAQIRKSSKLQTGTMYPILLRLERAGWLESRWEVEDPQSLGRPRRRYYRVTALGAQRVRVAVRDIKVAAGRLSWA